jgi:hypothetical protein
MEHYSWSPCSTRYLILSWFGLTNRYLISKFYSASLHVSRYIGTSHNLRQSFVFIFIHLDIMLEAFEGFVAHTLDDLDRFEYVREGYPIQTALTVHDYQL